MTIHILVIDDSPIERRRIGHLLQKEIPDALVTFAENGRIGYDTLSAITPDIVLSDMRMPEMNGVEFVKKLRADGCQIPVILMTSFGSEKIAVEALLAGASSYVPKLELESSLATTIFDILSLSSQRQHRRKILNTLTRIEFQFVIGNEPELVSPLVCHLLDQIVAMKLLKGQKLTHTGVALHEAISNAIHHGNLELDSADRQEDESIYYRMADERRIQSPFKDRHVTVNAKLSHHEITFTIADEGPGFDVENVLKSTAEMNLDRIGGRGLLLMRSFMDQIRFNEVGNEVTMVMSCEDSLPEQSTNRIRVRSTNADSSESIRLQTPSVSMT